MLMSSYDEAASEGVFNDSGFNDISCISYADRTIDEKDTVSRIDVSKESVNMSGSTAVNNSTDKSRLTGHNSSTTSSQKQSDNTKHNSSKNSYKRTYAQTNNAYRNCNLTNLAACDTAKRLKRDSARLATDGIAKTHPNPLAIPILCKQALPPDRLASGAAGSLPEAVMATKAAAATGATSTQAAPALVATAKNEEPPLKQM